MNVNKNTVERLGKLTAEMETGKVVSATASRIVLPKRVKLATWMSIDEATAVEFLEYRWLAFEGMTTRSHPDYHKKVIVREFFGPNGWKESDRLADAKDADGTEPLSYRYCSSCGPAISPLRIDPAKSMKQIEFELSKRGLDSQYVLHLMAQNRSKSAMELATASLHNRCLAALATVGSRFVEEV